jgi:anaerobic magnesium-protoporphyrin IX monomethyl ester cyclase
MLGCEMYARKKKMKILIIEPPAVSEFGNQRIFGGNGSNKSEFKKPPLDLMMISGYLRQEGFDNTLIDANASRRTIDQVAQTIKDNAPAIVFFSTSTCTIYKDLLIAQEAKRINPKIITVAVGAHVSAMSEDTFKTCLELDVIIYGREWEMIALNIVKNINNLKDAKGIYFKLGKDILKNVEQPAIQNLDDLGFPTHDKLEKDLYGDPTSKRYPKTMVMGQKACIGNCSFCCQPAFFGAPTARYRSVRHVLDELKWVSSLGFKEVMFNDATLTSDSNWAQSLFEGMVREKIDLTWNCSTRVECVNPLLLKLMKAAGCHTIALGLESTDPEVLKNIRKNVDPLRAREAVKMIRKAGIDTVLFCVVGFPGETKKSIETTIKFLTTLDTTYITLGIAVPAPGTDFYRYIDENNYFLTKDWSKFDPMQKPVFSYPGLSAEDIEYYSRYGLRQFYLRPSYILRRALAVRSFKQLKGYWKNFLGFLARYVAPKSQNRGKHETTNG